MKISTAIMLMCCLALVPGLAMAQAPTATTPSYDTAYGPFAPAPSSSASQYSTVTPQSAASPLSPSRVLPSAVGQKPFSNYQLRPAISPYMNLYRFNPGGVVNNYYSLVKPQVEQQKRNKTLQSATRSQGSAINVLNQKTDAMLDLHQPGYYMMNHNNYFGGR